MLPNSHPHTRGGLVMRASIAVFAVLVVACGRGKGAGGEADPQIAEQPLSSVPSEAAEPSAPAASPETQQERDALHALYVTDALPPCDAAGQGRLIYVVAEEVFKTCTGEAWVKVEIKVPAAAPETTWKVPVAGGDGAPHRWRLATLTAKQDAIDGLCVEGERLPTLPELGKARDRLQWVFGRQLADAPGAICPWVSHAGGRARQSLTSTNPGCPAGISDGSGAVLFCVAEK